MEEQIEEQKQSVETTRAPAAESNIQSAPAATIAEAQLGQRIGAAIIDVIVAIAVGWVASMISGRLYFPAFAAYMLTRDSLPFLNGQSIGKKVLNLQAVSESGKSLSGDWKTGLLRNVSMVIPFGGLVELIVMLVGKDKPGGIRRLGDQWAVTKVVSVSSGS
jgi:uncharacterized RDD family membrane protein YckC